MILCDGDTFSVDDTWLKHKPSASAGATVPVATSLAQHDRMQLAGERQMIEAALAAARGRVAGPNGAAAKLGIPRQTLDSKIASLRIDKYRYRST